MITYFFGKDFVIYYKYEVDSIPAATAPTIAVYSQAPSETDAAACTGTYKVGSTISTWADANTRPNTKKISIPAVDDPMTLTGIQDYYLAINYYLQSSEQVQSIIVPFNMKRVSGTISAPEVDPIDIKKFYPTVGHRVDDVTLDDFIDVAIDEIKGDLEKRNVRWDQVVNQNILFRSIVLKAAALSAYSEFTVKGDQQYTRWEDYTRQYTAEIDGAKLKVDTNQDGLVEKEVSKQSFFIVNSK